MATDKQRARQGFRNAGKYAKVNPCYVCGKSAGVDYFSHPMTDRTDANGQHWSDLAICLCGKCYRATEKMTLVAEYLTYVERVRVKS